MNAYKDPTCADTSVTISNFLRETDKDNDIRGILDGLTFDRKYISSKYFYDAAGAELFKEITLLPEYYLSRTEKKILGKVASEIAGKLKNIDLIEIGSGDSSKISILLESVPAHHMMSMRYIPIDVNQAVIEKSAKTLIKKFPGLSIHGLIADFERPLNLIPEGAKRLICFFGSTIGNISRKESMRFIAGLERSMRPGDGLLLGLDMVKERNLLHKAYNDSQNVTAKFNLNILNVVNNLLDSDFNPDLFDHIAFYNENHCRIEMHLKAKQDMEISCPYLPGNITLKAGETIHTENSHKFTRKHIDILASAGGLEIKNIFSDEKEWFSLVEFIKDE